MVLLDNQVSLVSKENLDQMVHPAVVVPVDLLDLVESVVSRDLRDNLELLAEMERMELVEHLVG